jgi:hypothetical protein
MRFSGLALSQDYSSEEVASMFVSGGASVGGFAGGVVWTFGTLTLLRECLRFTEKRVIN